MRCRRGRHRRRRRLLRQLRLLRRLRLLRWLLLRWLLLRWHGRGLLGSLARPRVEHPLMRVLPLRLFLQRGLPAHLSKPLMPLRPPRAQPMEPPDSALLGPHVAALSTLARRHGHGRGGSCEWGGAHGRRRARCRWGGSRFA